MKKLSVVIPVRKGSNPRTTLESLRWQTFQDFEVIVSYDKMGNANAARNAGFCLVRTPLVLFSDDDICWEANGLHDLVSALEQSPQASYSYGSYEMNGRVQCDREFDPALLKRTNYISTMSVIRSADFVGFDENIQRLQDWDLWLTLLSLGKTGVYCRKLVFRTKVREGITHVGSISWAEAERIVRQKHSVRKESHA